MILKGHNLDFALAVLATIGLAITLTMHQAEALDTFPPVPVEHVQSE